MQKKILTLTALLVLGLGACGGSKDEKSKPAGGGGGGGNKPTATKNNGKAEPAAYNEGVYGRWALAPMEDNGVTFHMTILIEKGKVTNEVVCESKDGRSEASASSTAKISADTIETLENNQGGDEKCGASIEKSVTKYSVNGDSLTVEGANGAEGGKLQRVK